MMACWRICYVYLIGNLVGASLLGSLLLVPLMRIGVLFGALFLLMIWVLHENIILSQEVAQLRGHIIKGTAKSVVDVEERKGKPQQSWNRK